MLSKVPNNSFNDHQVQMYSMDRNTFGVRGYTTLTKAGKLGRNIGACAKKLIFQSSFVTWYIDRCIVTVFVDFYSNKPFILKTVPPFVTAHMFCASRDIRVSLEICIGNHTVSSSIWN